MVARKEALGPQPDDAAAFRTTISADAKRLIKAVENHLHEIMKPYPWMPASGAIVGPRPGIIAAVFGNLVEIQQERRYHGITFGGGGSPASGFVDGGCWRTHRPVFFKIKKDPCSQGPLNLKFSACLSTDSENYPLPPNTLLWDATRLMIAILAVKSSSCLIAEKCIKKPESEIQNAGQMRYAIGTPCVRFG